MHESIRRARGMFANEGMSELLIKTRELIDEYGHVGAEIYLQAQLAMLDNLRDDEEEDGSDGDDF